MESPIFQLLKLLIFTVVLLPSGPKISEAKTITLTNNCASTIWPGIFSNLGFETLMNGGFSLANGTSSAVITPSSGWGGQVWGRTGCTFDATNEGNCETGDCGRGLQCSGEAGLSPVTLAIFNITGDAGEDLYVVRVGDGYNLPMRIVQTGGNGNCTNSECIFNLNTSCPEELRVVVNNTPVGCTSTCQAFNDDKSCCRNAYGTSETCPPTNYSPFKQACPTAYTYPYDGATIVACTGTAYEVLVVNNARVGCKSACQAFNEDQYCCCNAYNTSETCPPTSYSQIFKQAYPTAYTSPYDGASIVTCTGAAYEVIFCPA